MKTFAQMTTELLGEAGAAIANARLHPGWNVMLDLLERLEGATLERLATCDEHELRRLQGERDAVRELRRLLDQMPAIAGQALQQGVEDGEVENEELARYSMSVGEGELHV